MTVVVLPEPIPLELPPGDPAALEDFVEDVAGTGYRLAVVATCLSSSSASAPHWRGADASAAAAQVGVVARLADDLSAGVAAAAHRLRAHHDLLVLTRRRVATLRTQQDEEFAAAWGRLSRVENYQLAAMTGGPEVLAVVEDLQAAEAARRREYDRLLEELADDAAGAARALADACRTVGGTGRRQDSELVVAHLAAQLPGWGDRELGRLGGDLAEAMSGLLRPTERESLARDAVAYAGSAAFAAAFLAGLGETGVRDLLIVLGHGDLGPTSALARMLGLALGAAGPAAGERDPVGAVLTATYIDPDDGTTYPDLVAFGMGIVLRAGGTAGPRPETVVTWGRQMLARERTHGHALAQTRAVDRAAPTGPRVEPTDPVEIVLERLTGSGDPRFAADFLSERSTWDVLLSRPWDDGAIALIGLVDHAATAVGPVGGDAARTGLEALGAGLRDGDPDGWTVDRGTAAAVAESLGGVVAAHASLIAGVLERAADGDVGPRDGDVLRGLGYLTLDGRAARAVAGGLHDWASEGTGSSPGPAALRIAAVEGAFVATREYGQRLAYALHGFEQQAAAEMKEGGWDAVTTVLTLPIAPARSLAQAFQSDPFEIASDYAAQFFDSDGVWDNGVDDGLRFGRGDAVHAALGTVRHEGSETEMLASRAAVAYDGAMEALGRPLPPTSPVRDYVGPLMPGLRDLPLGRLRFVMPDAELPPEVADDLNRRVDDFLHD